MPSDGAAGAVTGRRRVLDPLERSSEVLFGIIMALTFTGSLSAATAGREEIRIMLFGAVGCNLAWGLVDAVMYLLNAAAERGRRRTVLATLRAAAPAEARRLIAEALPEGIVTALPQEALDTLRLAASRLPDRPTRPRLVREDFFGAVGVFLLVTLSTFPLVIPFILVRDPMVALRISNAVAIALLFLTGFNVGRYAGMRPGRTGLTMVAVGAVLVGLTMALGG